MSAPSSPEGLSYYPDGLCPEDLAVVTEWLASEEFASDLFQVPRGARKVAHYGRAYSYSTGASAGAAKPMPAPVRELRDAVADVAGVAADGFNQCIVNVYDPGEGIAPHVDAPVYGPVIACYTFGDTGRVMEFMKDGVSHELYTEPGSLYVMAGAARRDWSHGMARRKTDLVNGKRARRGRVVSVTFREDTSAPPG